MWYFVLSGCLAAYFLASAWFLAGSLFQIHLLYKSKRAFTTSKHHSALISFPKVTIQVPVYNERYVICRLLQSLGKMDYPAHLLEIQVLDDSTDDTSLLIKNATHSLRKRGIDVTILRRTDRTGYKAGSLQAGLPYCSGELIAIFDADFTPTPDFLKNMVGYFEDEKVGGVQARWTHRNLNENYLTRLQAFLLDSHFNLEQKGRAAAGYFLHFNGTAGIWRKQCIVDSGGWSNDVLSEDLELSYRAQLRGWKLAYDNHIVVPADLPADMNSFKTQQFRWSKGMAQAALLHLRNVSSASAGIIKKSHGFFHLMGSISFLAMTICMVMTIPILAGRHFSDEYRSWTQWVIISGITLPLLCTYYYFGTSTTLSRTTFWTCLPVFLVVYMALAIQNSIAVLQGIVGYSTPFIRTPKIDTVNADTSGYSKTDWTYINTIEVLVGAYLLAGLYLSFLWQDYFFLLFLLMVFAGLLIILAPAVNQLFQKKGVAWRVADPQ